jgi:Sigma-70, region 4
MKSPFSGLHRRAAAPDTGQRAALILHDVLGFPGGEIAGMLGTTPASVYSSLQRAHQAVRGRLQRPSQQATLRRAGAARQQRADSLAAAQVTSSSSQRGADPAARPAGTRIGRAPRPADVATIACAGPLDSLCRYEQH